MRSRPAGRGSSSQPAPAGRARLRSVTFCDASARALHPRRPSTSQALPGPLGCPLKPLTVSLSWSGRLGVGCLSHGLMSIEVNRSMIIATGTVSKLYLMNVFCLHDALYLQDTSGRLHLKGCFAWT